MRTNKNNPMNKITTTVLLALLLMATLAACTPSATTDDPIAPGTATPEGGNQPGVTIALSQPVISLEGVTAATGKTRAEGVIPSDNIEMIILLVDLLKADGTVSQSSAYYYINSQDWSLLCNVSAPYDALLENSFDQFSQGFPKDLSPITVLGGEGVYYMRATALVITLTYDRLPTSYSYTGTATVNTDGSFALDGNLKPYISAFDITLKDADGKTLTTNSGDYRTYLRGAAKSLIKSSQISENNFIVVWTEDGTRPEYCAYGGYTFITGSGTFLNVIPSTVPARWNEGSDGYISTGTTPGTFGNDDGILFSIYRKPADGYLNSAGPGKLPTNAAATYHVPASALANAINGSTGNTLTLAPGKIYALTITLNRGAEATITDITVGDFQDAGADGKIEL